jgi:hypothetical protein
MIALGASASLATIREQGHERVGALIVTAYIVSPGVDAGVHVQISRLHGDSPGLIDFSLDRVVFLDTVVDS